MIVVTGGAGFIGSNIVAALEALGAPPSIVCDRLRSAGKWRNIAKRALADVVPPEALFETLDREAGRIAAVIHMGAITSTTEADADKLLAVNLHLSCRLWEWCASRGVALIYASSAATYGDGGRGFDDALADDELGRLAPLNPYGWSKHLFDRWVLRRIEAGGPAPPQWAGLKFFNVYGPNEYHKGPMASVVCRFFPDVAAGRPVRLFQSHRPDCDHGQQRRDFIWIDDCVDMVLWLLDTPEASGLFNCGTGTARTFADLVRAMFAAVGREPDIEYVPMPEEIRAHYQYFTEARIERVRAAGYAAPFTSLEDGVKAYVSGYLDTDDPYL